MVKSRNIWTCSWILLNLDIWSSEWSSTQKHWSMIGTSSAVSQNAWRGPRRSATSVCSLSSNIKWHVDVAFTVHRDFKWVPHWWWDDYGHWHVHKHFKGAEAEHQKQHRVWAVGCQWYGANDPMDQVLYGITGTRCQGEQLAPGQQVYNTLREQR